MKKIIVISTSLRTGSNSDMLADQFIEGAKAAGHEVEKIYPESHLSGTLFCVVLSLHVPLRATRNCRKHSS